MAFDIGYAKRATKILLDLSSNQSNDLLFDAEEPFVVMTIQLSKVPIKPSPKHHLLQIPHPLWKDSELCLIISDVKVPETKAMIKSLRIPQVKKIIHFKKLKSNFKPYEEKRKLVNSYDLFISDPRITPKLPTVIGKAFFSKKKQPLMLELTSSPHTVKHNIERAINSTSITFSQGAIASIKVGRLANSTNEIAANIAAAIEQVLQRKEIDGWTGIQSIFLSCSQVQGISLPIYRRLPSPPSNATSTSQDTSSEIKEKGSEVKQKEEKPSKSKSREDKGTLEAKQKSQSKKSTKQSIQQASEERAMDDESHTTKQKNNKSKTTSPSTPSSINTLSKKTQKGSTSSKDVHDDDDDDHEELPVKSKSSSKQSKPSPAVQASILKNNNNKDKPVFAKASSSKKTTKRPTPSSSSSTSLAKKPRSK